MNILLYTALHLHMEHEGQLGILRSETLRNPLPTRWYRKMEELEESHTHMHACTWTHTHIHIIWVWDRVSLLSPGWPQTYHVVQGAIKFMAIPLPWPTKCWPLVSVGCILRTRCLWPLCLREKILKSLISRSFRLGELQRPRTWHQLLKRI